MYNLCCSPPSYTHNNYCVRVRLQHIAILLLILPPHQVAAEASRVLSSAGPVPGPQLVEEFNEALCGVAFDRANIQRGQQVVREGHLSCCAVLCCAVLCCVFGAMTAE